MKDVAGRVVHSSLMDEWRSVRAAEEARDRETEQSMFVGVFVLVPILFMRNWGAGRCPPNGGMTNPLLISS